MDKYIINARFFAQPFSGVQRFAFEMSQALCKMDPHIILAYPGLARQKFNPESTLLTEFGFLPPNLWEQAELPWYLSRKKNPLLINFGGLGPLFYNNKIITIHDLSPIRHPEWFSKKYSWYYRKFTPVSADRSRKIITVSQFSKKEIVALLKVPEEKVEVIYNASPWKAEQEKFVKEKEKIILAVGNIEPRKNFGKLIEAFSLAGLKDYRLVIAGAKTDVHSQAGLNGRLPENVQLSGFMTDSKLKDLYRRASLFVYPSLYEGFGIPPLEAMAAGCPVVASNTASVPEVCGKAAYYVNPFDVHSIKEGILKVIGSSELQKELIEEGFNNVPRFSWEKSAEKLVNIIKGL